MVWLTKARVMWESKGAFDSAWEDSGKSRGEITGDQNPEGRLGTSQWTMQERRRAPGQGEQRAQQKAGS